ncbi:MAG TPA: phenylalanine--tRNA ligase subunit alpha [Nitrososphaerales archaeon]|nr:phenylalanine--tRNA ligase subunit alpha [Nitrososphaerales archaeon]
MEKTPLHPIERKVLASVSRGPRSFEDLVSSSGLLPDQVRRSMSWLSSKGLVTVTEVTSAVLTATRQPPELVFIEKLQEMGGEASVAHLRNAMGEDRAFSAAMGRAISKGWVEVKEGTTGQFITLKDREAGKALQGLLAQMKKGIDETAVPPDQKDLVADLIKRGLVTKKESKAVNIAITHAGQEATKSTEDQGFQKLTSEILASVRATGMEVKLRPIDVSASAPRFHPGRRHPVKELIAEVREVYLSMGFREISGESVQSAFWNFDALFTPQDHPARELQDTFYVKGMRDDRLQRTGVVANVASAHEGGWQTGSKGWRYKWDVAEARRLVLRTHNTAVTIQATKESGGEETRVFSVARVYRNESLDYKHLAELHQMEGIVVGEGVNLRSLMGVLTKFYGKLGMSGVKLWPSYFPYTEPSMQVMVYYDKVGKWLEMGGSGIFRPEVTWPLGVKKPVIAWGCGLERLLMLRLGMEDIRDLYNNDLQWLRERKEIASAQDLL